MICGDPSLWHWNGLKDELKTFQVKLFNCKLILYTNLYMYLVHENNSQYKRAFLKTFCKYVNIVQYTQVHVHIDLNLIHRNCIYFYLRLMYIWLNCVYSSTLVYTMEKSIFFHKITYRWTDASSWINDLKRWRHKIIVDFT